MRVTSHYDDDIFNSFSFRLISESDVSLRKKTMQRNKQTTLINWLGLFLAKCSVIKFMKLNSLEPNRKISSRLVLCCLSARWSESWEEFLSEIWLNVKKREFLTAEKLNWNYPRVIVWKKGSSTLAWAVFNSERLLSGPRVCGLRGISPSEKIELNHWNLAKPA